MELSTPKTLLACIYILYDNKVDFEDMGEYKIQLMKALVFNEFYTFVELIRGLYAPE